MFDAIKALLGIKKAEPVKPAPPPPQPLKIANAYRVDAYTAAVDVKIIPGKNGDTFADVSVRGGLLDMASYSTRIKLRPDGDTLVGRYANYDSVEVRLVGANAKITLHDAAVEKTFEYTAAPVA